MLLPTGQPVSPCFLFFFCHIPVIEDPTGHRNPLRGGGVESYGSLLKSVVRILSALKCEIDVFTTVLPGSSGSRRVCYLRQSAILSKKAEGFSSFLCCMSPTLPQFTG